MRLEGSGMINLIRRRETGMFQDTTLVQLKHIALFRDFSDDELRYLTRDLEEKDYKKGESV